MANTGFMSRIKNLFGAGSGYPKTVASATTTNVPDGLAWVDLTGTATITSLTADVSSRNRLVYFHQSDSGTTTFTNTTGTTTANQMDLNGGNIALAQKDILILWLKSNGVWQLVAHKQNNATSVSVASAATTTVPDTGNVFVLTGTETITNLSATDNDTYREVTFIGGASCNVTFTNTNSPSSVGQMYCQGTNRILLEQDVFKFSLQPGGWWFIVSMT